MFGLRPCIQHNVKTLLILKFYLQKPNIYLILDQLHLSRKLQLGILVESYFYPSTTTISEKSAKCETDCPSRVP